VAKRILRIGIAPRDYIRDRMPAIVEFEEGAGGRKAPRLKYDDFQTRTYSRGRAH
jgi:hypothetical protein